MMANKESPLDIDDLSELDDIDRDGSEGSVGSREIVLLSVRSITVTLLLLGSILLVIKIARRQRGSWKEALLVVVLQIVWQVLAWYRLHIDQHWVGSLNSGTIDSENTRKVFYFMENMFHALAVYSGLVVVGRLAGIVGTLLWILCGMSLLAPVVFAMIILLLDLTLNAEDRNSTGTVIAVSSGRMVLLNLLPLGMLVSWIIGQFSSLPGCCKNTKSRRELASTMVCLMLLLFHLFSIIQWCVYITLRNTEDFDLLEQLVDIDVGLIEVTFILACMSLPWSWLLAMLIPIRSTSQTELDVNLKLAKQNKSRNIVKYKKETKNSNKPVDGISIISMATPPTSPQKFSPEVTSSPSVTSQLSVSGPSVITSPLGTDIPPTIVIGAEKKINKRRSYLEAVSNSSIDKLEEAQPRQSKSADPLWLPSTKPVQL